MLRASVSVLVIVALASACLPALAQSAQNKEQQEEVVRVGSNEVVLDAVVRDKKGRVVHDLTASDFEVYEDGVRQDVTSFRLVTRGATEGGNKTGAAGENKAGAAAKPDAATGRGVERVGAAALVFDRLSPESRVRARQAALAYLGGGLTPQDLVGVFGIDLSLRVYQRFTNNEQLLRQAIERAGAQNSAPNVSRQQEIADGIEWRDPEQLQQWMSELSKTEPVVVYCAYGFHVGCKTAIALREAGFDARYMKGGHSAWKASGAATRMHT